MSGFVLTPRAEQGVSDIWNYIADDNIEAADRVVAAIENAILNSPFREPDRHWRFTDEGITNEIVETRRASAYFEGIKGDVRECH